MRPFLAIHDVSGVPAEEVERALERVAAASHHAGIRPVETFYSPERGRAYTYFEASTDAQVRDACAAARLDAVDVAETRRVFTELLSEARRDR